MTGARLAGRPSADRVPPLTPALHLLRRPPLGAWRHEPRAEVAYHEAGHAVLATASGRFVGSATVVPQGATAGRVHVIGSREGPPVSLSNGHRAFGLLLQAAFALAGPEAERLAMSNEFGAERDRAEVEALLGDAARLVGVPAEWWREHLSVAVERSLRENWPAVERVTRLLLDMGAVDSERLQALLDDIVWLDVRPVAQHIAALAGVDVDS